MSKYKILITQADFLSPEKFIETYTQYNVKVVVEDVENEGTNEVHTSGYTERKLRGKTFEAISKEIEEIYLKENLRGECLGVYLDTDENLEEELFTEDDFNI